MRTIILLSLFLITTGQAFSQQWTTFRLTPNANNLPTGDGWMRYYVTDQKVQIRVNDTIRNVATEDWVSSNFSGDFWNTSGTTNVTDPTISGGVTFTHSTAPILVERTTTIGNDKVQGLQLVGKTTASANDNFGIYQQYSIEDNSALRNPIGRIGFLRNGADNSGRFFVSTYTTGSETVTLPLLTLNGLSQNTQTFATGTTGTNFNISSSGTTHTFNLPDASTTARGVVTTSTQDFAAQKRFIINTANNNSTNASVVLKHYTSANMLDGFGVNLPFYVQDDALVENRLGYIRFTRSGADNSGRFSVVTNNAGTESEKFAITPSGTLVITTTPTTDNTETQVLVRQSDGEVQLRDASTLGGGTDSGTTAFTGDCVSNCDDVSNTTLHYIRVGNVVSGHGHATVDATSSGTVVFSVPLPISSNFAFSLDAIGIASNNSDSAGQVVAEPNNDYLAVSVTSTGSGSDFYYFSFSYVVK